MKPFPLRSAGLICLAALALSASPCAAQPARTAPAPLSAADQGLAERARAYLQGLGAVRGRFTQTDPNGASSSGELYIQRPGKARFVYDEPRALLIVSDGAQVSVYDRRLKSFNAYPLGSTPLSLFLAREIRLDRGVEVTRVTRTPNGFSLTARDKRRQTRGWITLSFADAPLRLTEWTITDAQGSRTRVALEGLRAAGRLDPGLFVVRNPLRTAARR